MTKGTAIFLLGLFVIVVPSLGLPLIWKKFIFGGIGIIMLGIGYSLRRQQFLATLAQDGDVRTADTFVETTEPLFSETR